MEARTFTFGKYKGEAVVDVIYRDPEYVRWAAANIDFFELTGEEFMRLSEAFYNKRQQAPQEGPSPAPEYPEATNTDPVTLEDFEAYDRSFDEL